MGCYNGVVGDKNAETHLHSEILAQCILVENKDSIRSWTKRDSFHNLAKSLAAFCKCPED